MNAVIFPFTDPRNLAPSVHVLAVVPEHEKRHVAMWASRIVGGQITVARGKRFRFPDDVLRILVTHIQIMLFCRR